jgi:hypothetical protein
MDKLPELALAGDREAERNELLSNEALKVTIWRRRAASNGN